jgi:hypothetical protein
MEWGLMEEKEVVPDFAARLHVYWVVQALRD